MPLNNLQNSDEIYDLFGHRYSEEEILSLYPCDIVTFNKEDYDRTAEKLVKMFQENFKQYKNFPQEVVDAGPGGMIHNGNLNNRRVDLKNL